MAFYTEHFAGLRPSLYHWTFVENLAPIRLDRRLSCAAKLMELSGEDHLLHQRRETHRKLVVWGRQVYLRDQALLHDGNIDYEPGSSLDPLVAHLNRRVFFWAGNAEGPKKCGLNHYNHYEKENPAVIRVDTAELFKANPDNVPLFCKYNSGAPRCWNGRKIPRGASTFLEARQCEFPAHEVKEVTFLESVVLPDATELRGQDWQDWTGLFEGGSEQQEGFHARTVVRRKRPKP